MEFVSISKLSRFKDKIMGLLNQKAPLQSPSFTGSPTTPTPTQSTTGKVLVNQEYVANSVSGYLPLTGGVIEAVGDTPAGKTSLSIQHEGAPPVFLFSETYVNADGGEGNVVYDSKSGVVVGNYENGKLLGAFVGNISGALPTISLCSPTGSVIALSKNEIFEADSFSLISMNGENSLVGLTAPTEDSHATNKKYVDDADAVVKEVADSAKAIAEVALPKTGGTMTGSLVLNAAPTADLEAANKKYVDDTVLGAKPLAKELHFYGGCLSAANEANKVVTVSDDNFKLMSGVAVDVSFLNANTASRPTLNVNNTGAVEIKAYSTTVPLANQWRQGAVVRFVYNTSNWVMVDGSVASTTYYGATKLNSSTSSTSEDTAATPLAVKQAYDRGSTALTVASAAVPKSSLLRFTNVTFVANTGVTDTTYDGYAIRYDVSCTDVTTDYSADVRFAPADAVSGNFAPFCDTGNGIVKIYAKQAVKDNGGNITIPVIICTKMVD